MRIWKVGITVAAVLAAGCDDDYWLLADPPDAPRDLEGYYYAGAVDLSWRLGGGWDGEAFRVYGKRVSDPDYFFIAEVTSCTEGLCVYRDINVRAEVTYEYYVSAVSLDTGEETASDYSVEVYVPRPVPPPVPDPVEAVALDNSAYVRWHDGASAEEDFAFYRVYVAEGDSEYLVGETDSPGFLDFLAENGRTASYFVTSVDDRGHESEASEIASCTPRPDYTGEVMYSYEDVAASAGFRFQEADDLQAVMSGDSPHRHFRLESDAAGLWLAPGPEGRVHPEAHWTSALKCGVGSDADCLSWERAPMSGYSARRMPLDAGFTYMFQVSGDDGETRFGSVRASHLGLDQDGNRLIVFDWAYQTQAGNPSLSTAGGTQGW